jgi:hypothetical protein
LAQQTVNLPSFDLGGSSPSFPTMKDYNIKHGDNFSYVENVISNDEINQLMEHWNNTFTRDILTDSNEWDTKSPYKTLIDISGRNVEILGIPEYTFKFLSEKIKEVFSLVIDTDFGIEGPHYFTKYPVGGHHSIHTDYGTYNGVVRDKVITIQLTDGTDYQGGDLIIKGEVAPRSRGTFILYDGGDPHEVTKVTKGQRFSITECAGEKK